MSENCNSNCDGCESDCALRKENQNNKSRIKKIIGVASGKGGVGKSTITAMLASEMSKKGYKCAVLDADITGPSIPKAFGIDGYGKSDGEFLIPNVSKGGVKVVSINLLLDNETDPVIWRGPVIASTVKQFYTDTAWGDVDYLFVDMPPGTGDVALTVYQSIPLDGIVIVTTPQELVGMIVEKSVKMAYKMNIRVLALVENMSYFVCPDCNSRHNIFGESHIEDTAKRFMIDTVARLPMDVSLAKYCDTGRIEQLSNEELAPVVKKIEKIK